MIGMIRMVDFENCRMNLFVLAGPHNLHAGAGESLRNGETTCTILIIQYNLSKSRARGLHLSFLITQKRKARANCPGFSHEDADPVICLS